MDTKFSFFIINYFIYGAIKMNTSNDFGIRLEKHSPLLII